MRLLHSSNFEISTFVSDDDIPPYAILSHTWGQGEVSLRDWQTLPSSEIRLKAGYEKIQGCCEQARRDDLEWVWVDTCCIDKTSSAELSEAINSMFRWYQNAVVCYALLSDVPKCVDFSAIEANLAKSRWFTRGWTLQELIAPAALIFFSQDWHRLRTKSEMRSTLSSITGIETQFLDGENLELASAAKKMSWAASRKTSRTEDIAYSLLGIFDINMPLIYGEGKKAFRRLQEELLKARPHDHTIFAWGVVVPTPSIKIADISLYLDREPRQQSEENPHQRLLSLLAESPRDFIDSGGFIPMPIASLFYRNRGASFPYAVDGGVRLEIPVIDTFSSTYHWEHPKIEQIRSAKSIALLCCHETARDKIVTLPVQYWGIEYFGRTREILLSPSSSNDNLLATRETLTVATERRIKLQTGDVILRRHVFSHSLRVQDATVAFGDVANSGGVIEARKLRSRHKLGFLYAMADGVGRYGFEIRFGREVDAGQQRDFLLAEVLPIHFKPYNGVTDDYGLRWWPLDKKNDAIAILSRAMTAPLHLWKLDAKPLPSISIRAERLPLDEDGSFVDVLDIVIRPTKGLFDIPSVRRR